MSREIEIEFKNMVGKEDFAKLLSHFKISEMSLVLQHNHYFETEHLDIKRLGAALRLRQKEDTHELTLKRRARVGVLEINQRLDAYTAAQLLDDRVLPPGEVKDELLALNAPLPLIDMIGTLSTRRAQTDYRHGKLMFDKSSYLGKVDYEIEYEVEENHVGEGEKDFFELMKTLNIPLQHADSKIKRFFDEKRLLNMEGS